MSKVVPITSRTRIMNALQRASRVVIQAMGDDTLSATDQKYIRLIMGHIDRAMNKAIEMHRVDDDLEDFDECENCGTFVHDGPCVEEAQ